ncbi:CbiX family protein [Nocardia nova SH22a]|uniref:CbiX family protein n=1 Tax=Nocardia nova SH22a TaxID=1415166 RepID=W5TNR8_9NOCA|nr:sirohydrochlorin chelatase [Nocardia nova]AHH20613.1 CbiX family protein [Nocardia nova SH22a]
MSSGAVARGERTPFTTRALPAGTPTARLHRIGAVRRPAFIAVAHGSRDPRSAATMSAVVADIARRRPDLDVRLAFLDLNTPSVDQVVDAVAAQGHTEAIVVPLLLGSAFHARVDLPGILAAAGSRHPLLRLTQADVLGTDDRLVTALRERVSSAGADPADAGVGIAVAAVGSSSPSANATTTRVASALAEGTRWQTATCFATTEPALPQAISELRRRGARRVILAPWFLAPGLLTDRLAAIDPALPHAPTIGAHPLLGEVALDRYDSADREQLELSA